MISRHVFYVAKSVPRPPSVDDMENIPFLNIVSSEQAYRWLHDGVRQSRDRVTLLNPRGQKLFDFHKTPHAEEIFRHLDGKKSIREIFDAVVASAAAAGAHAGHEQLLGEFREIFDTLNNHGWLFLRAPATAAFRTVPEMQQRVARFYAT
jgi:hypothetical protein